MELQGSLLRFYEMYAKYLGVSLDEAVTGVLRDFSMSVMEQLGRDEAALFLS